MVELDYRVAVITSSIDYGGSSHAYVCEKNDKITEEVASWLNGQSECDEEETLYSIEYFETEESIREFLSEIMFDNYGLDPDDEEDIDEYDESDTEWVLLQAYKTMKYENVKEAIRVTNPEFSDF